MYKMNKNSDVNYDNFKYAQSTCQSFQNDAFHLSTMRFKWPMKTTSNIRTIHKADQGKLNIFYPSENKMTE